MYTERGFALFPTVFVLGAIGLFALALQGPFVDQVISSVAQVFPQSQVAAAAVQSTIEFPGGKLVGPERCNKPTEDAFKKSDIALIGTICVNGCTYVMHEGSEEVRVDSGDTCHSGSNAGLSATAAKQCELTKPCSVTNCVKDKNGKTMCNIQGTESGAKKSLGARVLKGHTAITGLAFDARTKAGAFTGVIGASEETLAAFEVGVKNELAEQANATSRIRTLGQSDVNRYDDEALEYAERIEKNLETNLKMLEDSRRIQVPDLPEVPTPVDTKTPSEFGRSAVGNDTFDFDSNYLPTGSADQTPKKAEDFKPAWGGICASFPSACEVSREIGEAVRDFLGLPPYGGELPAQGPISPPAEEDTGSADVLDASLKTTTGEAQATGGSAEKVQRALHL